MYSSRYRVARAEGRENRYNGMTGHGGCLKGPSCTTRCAVRTACAIRAALLRATASGSRIQENESARRSVAQDTSSLTRSRAGLDSEIRQRDNTNKRADKTGGSRGEGKGRTGECQQRQTHALDGCLLGSVEFFFLLAQVLRLVHAFEEEKNGGEDLSRAACDVVPASAPDALPEMRALPVIIPDATNATLSLPGRGGERARKEGQSVVVPSPRPPRKRRALLRSPSSFLLPLAHLQRTNTAEASHMS
ncbi:hypothetical protein HPB50_004695 [Hyalomma asiaticum]|uniref:Uncharacterized protein n=1 Tax=Hyalomma asiaticum TaxID=266040 RepID=A0ACB7ST43_HYAAI|nr:hypothetical protein HPB50_004695 [Hyalomma asiaticum]